MAGKKDYYSTSELETSFAWAESFLGCCGVANWFLQEASKGDILCKDLKILADHNISGYVNKSIALVFLSQKELVSHEPALLEFGFVRVIGPVVNINSKNNLYGYWLDLNVYRQKTTDSLKKSSLTTRVG